MNLAQSNPSLPFTKSIAGHKTIKIAKRLYLTQMDHGAICNMDVFLLKNLRNVENIQSMVCARPISLCPDCF